MASFKTPKILRNFYLVSGVIFVLWICLFDANDLITQYSRWNKVKELEKEKTYYSKEIKNIEKAYQDIIKNPRTLEKFAREKYFLQKPKEDVYVIVEEKSENTEEK